MLDLVFYKFLRGTSLPHKVLEFNAEILATEPVQAPEVGLYLTGTCF
jgi:hypothetical protein